MADVAQITQGGLPLDRRGRRRRPRGGAPDLGENLLIEGLTKPARSSAPPPLTVTRLP
ncbi:MAG: hypothetical protein R3F43_26955 [bacterium]